jgi:hypothetical protein
MEETYSASLPPLREGKLRLGFFIGKFFGDRLSIMNVVLHSRPQARSLASPPPIGGRRKGGAGGLALIIRLAKPK